LSGTNDERQEESKGRRYQKNQPCSKLKTSHFSGTFSFCDRTDGISDGRSVDATQVNPADRGLRVHAVVRIIP
jgi:hypothetical protein